MTGTTDADGHSLTWAYDALNRKTGEYDGPSTSSPQLASWVYDNANNAVAGMTNPVGHLTTETSYYGGNPYKIQQAGFDDFGDQARGRSATEALISSAASITERRARASPTTEHAPKCLPAEHRHPVRCQKSAWPVSCSDNQRQQ